MALRTMGTTAQTTLSAIRVGADTTVTDLAALMALSKDDSVGVAPNNLLAKATLDGNVLWIPNRGFLKVNIGDYIAVDSTGWPIVVSKNSALYGSTNWVHT